MSFNTSPPSESKRHPPRSMPDVVRSGAMLPRSGGVPTQTMSLMTGTTEASTMWPQWNASSIDDPQMLARNHPYGTTWDAENTSSEREYPVSTRPWGGHDARQGGPAYVSPYPDVWQSPNERFLMPAPGNQVWQQPSPAFTDYQQLSPSRSDGSSSTYASSIPSPYPSGVPVIKMEETPTSAPFSAQYSFGNAIHNTPNLAGSEFYTTSSAWSRKPFSTSMASIGQQAEDVRQSYDREYSHDIDSVRVGKNDPRMRNTNTSGRRSSLTPDTATIQCEICNKVFQRTNNLHTHMQVHDPERSHPHKCAFTGCGRGFVRKTDLARHEQSVHLKEKKHKCSLCNNSFARKDTLTRHIEDGCSMRPEVRKSSSKSRRPSAQRSSSYKMHSPSPASSPLRYPTRLN